MTASTERTPATCGACGSEELTRLPMVLTDGTEVTFVNCHSCEAREWLHLTDAGEWVSLPIASVLERSAKKQ